MGQGLDGLFPGILGNRLDFQERSGRLQLRAFWRRRQGVRGPVLQLLDLQGDVADDDHIIGANFLLGTADANAVEKGAVHAAQISDHPALGGDEHFSMTPADGGDVEDNFHRVHAADAQNRLRFPFLPLERRGHRA